MLRDASSDTTIAAGAVTATAFRDDGKAELVTITRLSFIDCLLESKASFAVGERLRLHLRGQGWIEAQVRSVSADSVSVVFLAKSRC